MPKTPLPTSSCVVWPFGWRLEVLFVDCLQSTEFFRLKATERLEMLVIFLITVLIQTLWFWFGFFDGFFFFFPYFQCSLKAWTPIRHSRPLPGSCPAQDFCDFLRVSLCFPSIHLIACWESLLCGAWLGWAQWQRCLGTLRASLEVLHLSVQLNPKFTLGFYSTSEKKTNLALFIGTSEVTGQSQLLFSSSARCCLIHE